MFLNYTHVSNFYIIIKIYHTCYSFANLEVIYEPYLIYLPHLPILQ
jgi:hypothetical protein